MPRPGASPPDRDPRRFFGRNFFSFSHRSRRCGPFSFFSSLPAATQNLTRWKKPSEHFSLALGSVSPLLSPLSPPPPRWRASTYKKGRQNAAAHPLPSFFGVHTLDFHCVMGKIEKAYLPGPQLFPLPLSENKPLIGLKKKGNTTLSFSACLSFSPSRRREK